MGGDPTSFQIIPLDLAILAVLPDEGTRLGFTELGKQVKSITADLNGKLPSGAPKVTSASINGRIRMLKQMGCSVSLTVQPVSNGLGWQRTAKGKALLEHEGAEL